MIIRLRLPEPHAGQRQVITQSKRFNVVCCGRRWGKTQMGIDRVLPVALSGKPAAWYGPTYKLAAPAWRELLDRAKAVTKKADANDRRIELVGGGSIDMWSLDDPDAGRGRCYALAIVDEAAMVRNLRGAWQESIRPQLTDYRGSAWFLSTPKGVAGEFFALFNRGQDPEQKDWASWQMPTSTNPYIHGAEIEAAKEDLSELAFAQEYLAQFVSWEGSVFRRILDAVHDPEGQGKAASIGVDWARGAAGDYTVFVAVEDSGQVLELDRFRGMEYSLQRARLSAFWERHGKPQVLAEYNSIGGPVIEQLQREGIPVKGFVTTNASKAEAVEALALAFERGEIKIPNDPVLIGELQAFEAVNLPSGLIRYTAPSGGHDDTVIALAIAWVQVAKSRKGTGLFPLISVGRDDGRENGEEFERPSAWRNF